MDKAISELKIQAKKLLKLGQQGDVKALTRIGKWHKNAQSQVFKLQLKHCQLVLARELGFNHWASLQQLLSGNEENQREPLDFGSLFYTSACGAFINQWFASYNEAKKLVGQTGYLLPYKKQFVVVNKSYIETIGIKNIPLLNEINRDLYQSYPSDTWDTLLFEMLRKD